MIIKCNMLMLLVWVVLTSACAHNSLLFAQGPERRARYVVHRVTFNGVKSLSKQTLLSASRLRLGSVLADIGLDRASRLVSAAYIKNGFSRVHITQSKQIVSFLASDRRPRVNIVFDIEEGPQFLVRFLEIVGTQKTNDGTVRRATGIKPWDPYNPSSLEIAIKRLRRIHTLDAVRKEDIQIRFDESNHVVDLRFNLKEKS
jgi:outer membrane protein assembly factor BamA